MTYSLKTAKAPIGSEFIKNGHLIRKVATGYRGWQSVHRIVMSEQLGRPLESWELVHHINGDKLDNNPENLRIVTRVEHTRIHNEDKPPFSNGWNKTSSRPKSKGTNKTQATWKDSLPIGSERLNSNGYLTRKVTTGYQGWKPVHRLIMEERLGRPLFPDEIVHHINHNKLDNRPENLEVMTQSEHSSHHNTGRRGKGIGGNKRPPGKWAHRYDACAECGTSEIPHWGKGLCKECYPKVYMVDYKQRPEYYEKKQEYWHERRKMSHLSSGKWAINYDACIECGTTERRHVGHGLCNACNVKRRYYARKQHSE